MTALDPTPTTPSAPHGDEDEPRRITPGKVAAVLASLAIVLFWIWVFATGGSYHPPGWLEDRTFPEAAEEVCASFTPQLEAIPLAQTATTSDERADFVDAVTVLLAERRDALAEIVPDTDDARFISAWLDDWSTHLDDRQVYADELRVNPAAEYMESTKETSQISKVLDKFAKDNEMASCVTYADV